MNKFKILFILLVLFSSFCFFRCSEETEVGASLVNSLNLDTVSFTRSMKGWELYSWPNGKDFNYTFLVGTNRTKTYEEVVNNKLMVSSKDSLKLLLDKFPENESIFWFGKATLGKRWNGNPLIFCLPGEKTVNEIKAYCIQRKLSLMIGD